MIEDIVNNPNEFEDVHHLANKEWHALRKQQIGDSEFTRGTVHTEQGIVEVTQVHYLEPTGRFTGYLRLELIYQGKLSVRTWNTHWEDRMIIGLAKKFAEQIAEQHNA